jgi:putative peptidoglycan lipid II flippase
MFQRISALINTSFHGVQQAALVVSVFTLASQILGLLRDRLLAGTYGAGASLYIYYTAFRIPDILFVAVASFFSFTILIPFFIERERKSHESAREFISTMFSGFMIMMSVVAMAAYFMMPWLVRLIAPGFEGSMLDTTIELSRWLILSPVILGLSNLFSTITQSQRKFLIYALSPVLYNIGIIAGILFLQPIFGLQGIIYGVIGGTILHLLIQLPVLLTSNYIPHFKIDVNWGHIWAVMRTSLPRTLTLAFSTITLTILGAMATTISSGSVAIFDLSKNLHSVPIALIGISFSVAAFPSLVILYEEGNIAMFARRIREAARHIIF